VYLWCIVLTFTDALTQLNSGCPIGVTSRVTCETARARAREREKEREREREREKESEREFVTYALREVAVGHT